MNYRVRKCSEILEGLPGVGSLLDVGCRDCILSNHIPEAVAYKGVDLFQNQAGSVDYVGDFLALDIHEQFDIVVALDVVEHVDDAGSFVEKLFKQSRRYVIIALPNSYSIVHWREFLSNGNFGKKYTFNPFGSIDRHRWMISPSEAMGFYSELARRFNAELVDTRTVRFAGRFGRIVPSFRGLNVRGVIGCFELP